MNRYVVVSTNNNPDYLFFAPYIEKAWNKLGWNLCIVITEDVNREDIKVSNPDTKIIRILHIDGVRKETIAQAGRLYAANYFTDKETLLMTSDMDLLPLSDYWNPDPNKVTIYGHDLTWYSFYPMGYVAMSVGKWRKYIDLQGDTENEILRDVNNKDVPHSALSEEWEQWWNFDWSLLTHRLKPHEADLTFINRGQIDIAGATLAKGRIDRYNWEDTQNQPEPFIDAHCENNNVMHPDKLEPFLKVFNKFYPNI